MASAVRYVPFALGLAYLCVLAVRLPRLLEAVSHNSDAISPAVLSETRGPGATVLGDISYLTTLGFDWLTSAAPDHRALWALAPYVLSLVGSGFIAWGAWRVGGRWACGLTFALSVATSPAVLLVQLAPAFHGTTVFTTALLGAVLLWLVERPRLAMGARVALIAGIAIVAGANLAADPLLAPAALAPFALAPFLIRPAPEGVRALRVTCVVSAALSVAVGAALLAGLAAVSITPRRLVSGHGNYFDLVTVGQLRQRPDEILQGTLALLGPSAFTGAILAVIAVLLPVVYRRAAVALQRDVTVRDLSARGYQLFWILSATLVIAAAALSGSVSSEGTAGDRARYLAPVFFGLAALAGAWAARATARRVSVALAATLYLSVSILALVRGDMVRLVEHGQLSRYDPALRAWLSARSLEHGYAGYWDANVLRYEARLPVSPVVQCDSGATRVLCPDRLNARSTWFAPSDATRSFLVVDPTPGGSHVVSTLPPRAVFGAPLTGARFGPISVWVYPYDLASRLSGPWSVRG